MNDLSSVGAYTRQDISDTDETLSIDKEKEVSFYVREIDEIQHNYKVRNEYADDAAVRLGNKIDGDVLVRYQDADHSVDDGDLGGTDGNGFTISTNNVLQTFLKAGEKLDDGKNGAANRFAVISPQVKSVLYEYIAGKDTDLADEVGQNGRLGRWNGFEIFQSNNLGTSIVLSLATNPTDGDTVSFTVPNDEGAGTQTVTFRFKDALAANGDLHIGSTVDDTRDNFATALGDPFTDITETATAGYDAFASTSDEAKVLKKVASATNDDSADTLSIVFSGAGRVTTSETLSDGTDTWTDEKTIQHNLFGVKGATDLAIQVRPNMRVKERDGHIGVDVVSWTVYGVKTFDEGDNMLVDVQVRSDSFN